MMKSQ